MESRVNYTIVGLFVVLLTVAIVSIALWLTQNLQEKPYTTYLVYMSESVVGLSIQAPVKYNGVDVGYVANMKINLKNPQQVILKLKIEPYVPVTEDTKAILMSQGVTGIAYIGLQGGKPDSKPLEIKEGENYPVIKSAPSFLVRLDQSLDGLTSNINSLSTNIKELLDQENLNSVHDTLKNLDELTATLAQNRTKLNESMTSLNVTLKNTASASRDLPNLINKLYAMTQSVSSASQGVNSAATAFNNQLIPETYTMLEHLKIVSGNLQQFSTQLNQDPAMLIRGKAPQKAGPGE